MIFKFFDEKTSGGTVKNEIISNKELVEELHKQIIINFDTHLLQTIFRAQI